MSNLLSTTEITSLTGQFNSLWDTLSQFTQIVVNKEPIKTITNANTNSNLPGYSTPPNQQNVTYTPVSGIFPAIAMYDKPAKPGETLQEVKVSFGKGKIRIKVKPDAAEYINNGTTENIILNSQTYNTISDDGIQNYLGLKYHYFLLERTT